MKLKLTSKYPTNSICNGTLQVSLEPGLDLMLGQSLRNTPEILISLILDFKVQKYD